MSESTTTAAAPTVVNDHATNFRILKAIGILGIVGGILMIGGGAVAWAAVSTELRAEKIVEVARAVHVGLPCSEPPEIGAVEHEDTSRGGGGHAVECSQARPPTAV